MSFISQLNTQKAIITINSLPDEIIAKHIIADNFNPSEVPQIRLVCKRLARVLTDNTIWKKYYHDQGLDIPIDSTDPTREPPFFHLARTLPIWLNAKQLMDAAKSPHFSRSTGTAILTIPELYPLHRYAIKIIEQNSSIPMGLSSDEVCMEMAQTDDSLSMCKTVRRLAIQSISRQASKPKVQEALISIITRKSHQGPFNLKEKKIAIEGLGPYANCPKVTNAMFECFERNGPSVIETALAALSQDPIIFDRILDLIEIRAPWEITGLVNNHLNNNAIVGKLIHRLSATQNYSFATAIAKALMPLAHEKAVQEAFCQKLANLPRGELLARQALETVIKTAQVAEHIKTTYCDRVPLIQAIVNADRISKIVPKKEGLKRLISTLKSENRFERIAAAKVLSPLLPFDPVIIHAFIDSLSANKLFSKDAVDQKAAFIIVSALAKAVHLRHVRKSLIQASRLTAPRSREIENVDIYLVTIRALSPYSKHPEILAAFKTGLENRDDIRVRNVLIEVLAPELERKEIRALFLRAAKGKLYSLDDYEAIKYRRAAIDQLRAYTHFTEVKDTLMELFIKEGPKIKIACSKALCKNANESLFSIEEILEYCSSPYKSVRKEARRLLAIRTQFPKDSVF